MRLDPATDILGVVDVQPTFMPGGELPVAEGDAVVPVINLLTATSSATPSPRRTGIRQATLLRQRASGPATL